MQDWEDLWRPELAGKIAMVDSTREVIGMVLKSMGASYNTENIDIQVSGGKEAVRQKLVELVKQVRTDKDNTLLRNQSLFGLYSLTSEHALVLEFTWRRE